MKIPKVFMPDKNLGEKVEELNTDTKTISIKELLKNDMQMLYGDAETYSIKRYDISERIFNSIIKDTLAEKIGWIKDPQTPERYAANVTIKNYAGKEINMPILFITDDMLGSSEGFLGKNRWGYLYIGDERGPCRNTRNEDVKRLATEYFKIDLTREKVKTIPFK